MLQHWGVKSRDCDATRAVTPKMCNNRDSTSPGPQAPSLQLDCAYWHTPQLNLRMGLCSLACDRQSESRVSSTNMHHSLSLLDMLKSESEINMSFEMSVYNHQFKSS